MVTAHPDCAQHLAVVHKETQTSSFETGGGCGSVAAAAVPVCAAAADMGRVKPEAHSDFCIDRYAFRYLDTTLKIALKITI